MNLHRLLLERAKRNQPIRAGLIGAGEITRGPAASGTSGARSVGYWEPQGLPGGRGGV